MTDKSWRALVAPVLVMTAGFTVFAAEPLLNVWLDLPLGRLAGIALRGAGGILLWLAVAWLAARCCDLMLHRLALVSRAGIPFPRLLTDLLRAALFVAAAVMILTTVFDRPASGLVTLSSVVLAVIGFALRNVINDLFSSIALGIDHPYRIGDWIETAQGAAGKVTEITWRTTRLTDRNGFSIILPNGLVSGHRLNNYSSGDRDYRTALKVPLDAKLPVVAAKRLLLSGALDADRLIPGMAPDVLLAEYTDGAAVYVVRFRVPDFAREATCRDAIAARVLNALHCVGQTTKSNNPLDPDHLPSASPRDALLDHVELFRVFEDTERAELAVRMRAHHVRTGEVVFHQGEAGETLYVLGEGLLDVEVVREGAPPILNHVAPGQVFGEMALLTREPRTATLTAALDSVVYEISKDDLDSILKNRPSIADGLAAMMAERLAYNERHGREPEPEAPRTRDDFLARLRLLFGL